MKEVFAIIIKRGNRIEGLRIRCGEYDDSTIAGFIRIRENLTRNDSIIVINHDEAVKLASSLLKLLYESKNRVKFDLEIS